ncbi:MULTISPECIES: hypothetical protein [Curtobacterium]|uniref:hypothetical protein n=1 Tax=Curtobacterium TaxID=2034 RepID=UPI00217E7C61|nr:hypothetical protein [Curtobacterium flaccumfaciens]MCS6562304.1 hypothetical protein [Curtobacterium flaccumfaciens pv. poinsettiae]UXN28372.1 hypothetical protein N8D75_15435 [Curtobacterium flaccumfaciens]
MSDSFTETRIKEMQNRSTSGPPISFRLSVEDDREAERIAEQLKITKPALAKAGLLALIDGVRHQQSEGEQSG